MTASPLPPPQSPPRILFAGDRDIAVDVLDVLLADDVLPVALLLPDSDRASHDDELLHRCSHLPENAIFRGSTFRSQESINILRDLAPDFLLSVHFPYLIPPPLLDLPAVAPLNLHPAYLPFNRGWHTPSWALLDDTPFGATLHLMGPDVDDGPIIERQELPVRPDDTAHALYQRVKALEVTVFQSAWPRLRAGTAEPVSPSSEGTLHTKEDLHTPTVQQIDPDAHVRAGTLLDRLRALTTNRLDEAAYVEQDGTRYRIQISITPDPDEHPPSDS